MALLQASTCAARPWAQPLESKANHVEWTRWVSTRTADAHDFHSVGDPLQNPEQTRVTLGKSLGDVGQKAKQLMPMMFAAWATAC